MILLTGATGAMGSVLVQRLIEKGHRVRVLTLPNDPGAQRVAELGAEIRYGDVARREDVTGVCEGVSMVYHLAAIIIAKDQSLYQSINVNGTAHVLEEAKRAGVSHFVHISSASVLYPHPTPYSLSKRKGEELVRASGLNWTIVRPTLVYGKKGGQEFDQYLDYLQKFAVVPFIGSGKAKKRPVYVGDIIEGLIALEGKKIAYGKIYNFSGGESISMLEFSRLCLTLMNQDRKPFLFLPVWLCIALAKTMQLIMRNPPLRWPVIAGITQDADLDPAEAMRDLGYSPAKVSEKLREFFPR